MVNTFGRPLISINTFFGRGPLDSDGVIISNANKHNHKHFSSPLAPLSGLAHTSAPRVWLIGGRSVCRWEGNTHFDSRIRLVLLRRTPGVIYFPSPRKMHSASYCTQSHCIIHSLGLARPLRPRGIILQRLIDANKTLPSRQKKCLLFFLVFVAKACQQRRWWKTWFSIKQLLRREKGARRLTAFSLKCHLKAHLHAAIAPANNKFLLRSKLILYDSACDWSAPP